MLETSAQDLGPGEVHATVTGFITNSWAGS